MKTIIKVCFMALAVLLAATPLLACGGPEAPPPAPAPAPSPAPTPPTPAPPPSPPSGNQPPVITSVTAEPPKVVPGGTSTITCAATDPDGDNLSYTWSVTGGTFSRAEEVILWQAPEADGEFVISVTVKDGKGGTAEKQVTIIAGTPPRTIVLDPLPDESGSVYFTGDLVSSWLVGDNAVNNGVRAYFSFDISGFALAEIKEAKLTFNTKEIVGDPWLIHAFMYVEQVDYGERPLRGGDFDIDGFELAKSASSAPGAIDVALPIERLMRPPAKHRLQVRLRLGQPTNHNSQDDYISFSGATISITYVK